MLKKTALILFVLISNINLFAKECSLSYSTMYLIAMNERATEKEIGYPYLISFNKKKDAQEAKKIYKELFFNSRTLDCKNADSCTKILSSLLDNGSDNLDLGAFQINYHFHKIPISHYFKIDKSYSKSCEIAEKFIDKNNVTFEDLARYHSSTKKYNARYARALEINYNKIVSR